MNSNPELILNQGVWELILSSLAPEDIFSLRKVSLRFKNIIEEYVRHYVKSNQLIEIWQKLNMDCKRLLTTSEQFLASKIMSDSSFENLLLYKYHIEESGLDWTWIQRQSCIDAVKFDHIESPHYVDSPFDKSLERNIVKLNDVCWLYYWHIFKDVEPGQYIFRVRMKVGSVRNYPEESVTTIKVKKMNTELKDEEATMSVGKIQSKCFKAIRKSKPEKIEENLEGIKIIPDFGKKISSNTWFYFQLEPFTLNQKCDLATYYFDCSPYWKSGLFWDYVELIRV